MLSSRGKKTAIPASKKRKGVSSSAGPTAKIRHPFVQFPKGPQEELFQILRAEPLATARCIDTRGVFSGGQPPADPPVLRRRPPPTRRSTMMN